METTNLRNCLHEVPTETGTASFHKIKIVAKTFGVTVPGVLARLGGARALPHERVGRWLYVSDDNLRDWFRSGFTLGEGTDRVTSDANGLRTLTLACGHVVESIPQAVVTQVRPGDFYGRMGRREKLCAHEYEPARHGVRIIARTYGVAEPTVMARIRTLSLPTERTGSRNFVSDDNLKEWIRIGIRFGNGASTYDYAAKTFTLACGHVVEDVAFRENDCSHFRLTKCFHEDPSGPAHSVAAIARTLSMNPEEIFQKIPSTRLRTRPGTNKVYAFDAAVRRLGATGRLACGYVLPAGDVGPTAEGASSGE